MADFSKYLERGRQALDKKNYDYAIDSFKMVLNASPNTAEAFEDLRKAAVRKFKEAGGKSSSGTRAFSMVKSITRKAMSEDKVINNSIATVCTDPYDVTNLMDLAAAAEKKKYFDLAISAYTAAIDSDKKLVDAYLKLAKLHEQTGNPKQAQECLQQAVKIDPTNHVARKYEKELAATISMHDGGWTKTLDKGKGAYREVMKDKTQAAELEKEEAIVRTEDDLEGAVARITKQMETEPEHAIKHMRKLGDLYMSLNKHKEATEWFNKVLEKEPADSQTMSKIRDMKIRDYDAAIAKLQAAYEKTKSQEYLEKLKQYKIAKLKFAIVEFERRVKETPTDVRLKNDLGQLYMQGNLTQKAIEMFQHAVKDPKFKQTAAHNLGQCFARLELYDSAITQYKAALELLPSMNDARKQVIYHMADAYEKDGQLEEAMKSFQKIFESDISFSDVAQRLSAVKKKLKEGKTA